MNTILLQQIALAIVRHALTAFGLTEVVSSDDAGKAAGAIAFLIGIGWSIYRKVKTSKKPEGA